MPVDLQRFGDEILSGGKIEGLRELDLGRHHDDARVAGRELGGFGCDRGGVPGVVFVEEQLRAPEQCFDALFGADLLGFVEGVVGVAVGAQQIRRAAHHRQAFGIVGGDLVAVVGGDDLHERRLCLGSFAAVDQQLAEQQSCAVGVVFGFHRPQDRDRVVDFALAHERFGVPRGELDLAGLAADAGCRRGRLCRSDRSRDRASS